MTAGEGVGSSFSVVESALMTGGGMQTAERSTLDPGSSSTCSSEVLSSSTFSIPSAVSRSPPSISTGASAAISSTCSIVARVGERGGGGTRSFKMLDVGSDEGRRPGKAKGSGAEAGSRGGGRGGGDGSMRRAGGCIRVLLRVRRRKKKERRPCVDLEAQASMRVCMPPSRSRRK